MRCTLCNEAIDSIQLDFEEVIKVDDEYWHTECYAEYFGELFEEA